MGNGIALVLAIALVAALIALVVVVLRRSPGQLPARPADPQITSPQDDEQRQRVLADASREAGQIRVRAESEAGAIVSRAEAAAEQSAQARREVENEIRAVKEEVRLLRSDLERREARLAEREQRIDEDARKTQACKTVNTFVRAANNRPALSRVAGDENAFAGIAADVA